MKSLPGTVSDINDLEFLFKNGNRPIWTVNRGNSVNNKFNEIITRNTELEDIDEAWDMLKKSLQIYKYGLFKIFATDKVGNTNGNIILYSVGMSEQPASNMPATINGVGQVSQYDNSIGAIVHQEIQKEKKVWELEKEVDELKASINGKQSFTDRIGAMLENSFPQLIEIVLPAIIQKMTGVTPQPGNIAGIQQTTEQITDDATDIINSSLQRIEAAGIDLIVILPKLADMVEKNPTMIKGFLNSL